MKKILIIDDHSALRHIMTYDLTKSGFLTKSTKFVHEGVELAKSWNPDLILMDMMVPGKMNGIEGTETLAKTLETQNIPVVIVTAKTRESDLKKAIGAGAKFCLIKPFKYEELHNKIKELLGVEPCGEE